MLTVGLAVGSFVGLIGAPVCCLEGLEVGCEVGASDGCVIMSRREKAYGISDSVVVAVKRVHNIRIRTEELGEPVGGVEGSEVGLIGLDVGALDGW